MRHSDEYFSVFETLREGEGTSLRVVEEASSRVVEESSLGGERGLARALSMVPPGAGQWVVRERSLLQRTSAGVMQLDLGRSRRIDRFNPVQSISAHI